MISEEERKAIEYLKYLNKNLDFNKTGYVYGNENLELILNLIKTQNKMIGLMAEDIKDADDYINSELNDSEFSNYNKQQIIEYFRNKAKESE